MAGACSFEKGHKVGADTSFGSSLGDVEDEEHLTQLQSLPLFGTETDYQSQFVVACQSTKSFSGYVKDASVGLFQMLVSIHGKDGIDLFWEAAVRHFCIDALLQQEVKEALDHLWTGPRPGLIEDKNIVGVCAVVEVLFAFLYEEAQRLGIERPGEPFTQKRYVQVLGEVQKELLGDQFRTFCFVKKHAEEINPTAKVRPIDEWDKEYQQRAVLEICFAKGFFHLFLANCEPVEEWAKSVDFYAILMKAALIYRQPYMAQLLLDPSMIDCIPDKELDRILSECLPIAALKGMHQVVKAFKQVPEVELSKDAFFASVHLAVSQGDYLMVTELTGEREPEARPHPHATAHGLLEAIRSQQVFTVLALLRDDRLTAIDLAVALKEVATIGHLDMTTALLGDRRAQMIPWVFFEESLKVAQANHHDNVAALITARTSNVERSLFIPQREGRAGGPGSLRDQRMSYSSSEILKV